MALAPLCPMLSPFSEGNQSFLDIPFPPTQARSFLSLQRQQACVEHLADFSFPSKGSQCGPFLLRVQPSDQNKAVFQQALVRMQKQKGGEDQTSKTPLSAAAVKTTTSSAAPLPALPVSPLGGRRVSPQRHNNNMVDLTPRKPTRFNRLVANASPKGGISSNKSTILRTLSSGRLMASPSRSPTRSNISRRTKSGSGLLRY